MSNGDGDFANESAPPTPVVTPAPTGAWAGEADGTRYVVYDNGAVNVGGSAAWRNNNPGNIVAGSWATDHGAVGSAGGFAVFPTSDVGTQAMGSLLRGPSYHSKTVQDAIDSYAPPSENDTTSYLADVCARTGLKPETPMSNLNDDEFASLTDALAHHEGWQEGDTFSRGDPNLPDAIKDALPPWEVAPESQASSDPENPTETDDVPQPSDESREGEGKPGDDGPNETDNIGFHH